MGLVLLCGLAMGFAAPLTPADDALPADAVTLQTQPGQHPTLTLDGQPFHQAAGAVLDLEQARVPGSEAIMMSWTEATAQGEVGYTAISLTGQRVERVAPSADTIRLRYAEFDPDQSTPAIPGQLAAAPGNDAYIVQFIGQPVEAADLALEAAGATILRALHDHARIVRMGPDAKAAIEAMGIVRWVGNYEPAYKLEEEILQPLVLGGAFAGTGARYSIELLTDGNAAMDRMARVVTNMGAAVNLTVPEVGRLEATLTPAQILAIAADSDVLFIDRWQAPENDMNLARSIGGANYIEGITGFSGEGVRGEVMDSGLLRTHQEFTAMPPLLHGSTGVDSHGTGTYSINFARGASSIARGMVPDAQGIFASYNFVGNRYAHTAQLINPSLPYRAVYQTNSWGSGLTTTYTTASSEMDRIIFDMDILITQSQSNQGSQQSRPQAWSKNIVSVGGVAHRNTITKADDCWCSGASRGPASDGRIKPDLTHFFDFTRAAHSSSASAYQEFGGTSGATPIVSGHFGVLFQMWSEGVFGNPTSGGDVFDERPSFTTAKALMIASADPYNFTGTSTATDKARVKQGWGMPDLRPLYDGRDEIFIVNEDDVLTELQTAVYPLKVPAGTPELRTTLTWADPQGTTSSTVHRINNLDLKITSPSGDVYWGNGGLNGGIWSTTGGSADTVNTVENVFVQNPDAGTWTVEVFAADINVDGHRETGGRDADFALVVMGTDGLAAAFELPFEDDFPDLDLDTEKWIEVSASTGPTSLGMNPPSEPYSLLMLNDATLASSRINVPIDLIPDMPVEVAFHSQHRGVESGKTLNVEYYSGFHGEWRDLTEVVSDGSDQTTFTASATTIPLDAYGDGFRVRFTTPGSDVTDFWYIDDVRVQIVSDDPTCRADLDGDGSLTIFDFLEFQNLFSSGDLAADFDGDGQLNIFDFLAFQNEFAAGC
ncbi:MAG: S8 family serine peptidase [Phycisphaera sp.]|nr:MAG: S8 family serine peptidase [Phycisphaera sp.]